MMQAATLRSPPIRIGLLLLAAILLVFLLGRLLAPPPPPLPVLPDRTPTNGAPRDFASALVRIDRMIVDSRARARARGGEWLIQEKFANDLIQRGRLTGSFDDYAEAQRALDHGFATAPAGAGPHLTQASLDMSMHRLDRAARALDAIDRYVVPPEPEAVAEVGAMRGDIAFYRGDYAGALARYRTAAGGEPVGGLRLAYHAMRTGKPDAALAAIDRVERRMAFPTAQMLANLSLLRGSIELQRGRWDAASVAFDHAARLFPGSWLVAAHRAQMLALTGRRADAIRAMERVAQASGAPDAMDALASLYRAEGRSAPARDWAARAGAIWARRLALFPEAAYGHAVEHELAFGDPRRALDLAEKDYAARPHGATAVALGWARLANNDPAGALAAVRPLDAAGWVSAEQHLVAAQAEAMLGRTEPASAERDKALAINPRAADPAAALIWFGH